LPKDSGTLLIRSWDSISKLLDAELILSEGMRTSLFEPTFDPLNGEFFLEVSRNPQQFTQVDIVYDGFLMEQSGGKPPTASGTLGPAMGTGTWLAWSEPNTVPPWVFLAGLPVRRADRLAADQGTEAAQGD
jgi:hypothetical protein